MRLRETIAALACALPIFALAQSSSTTTTTVNAGTQTSSINLTSGDTSITGSAVAISPSATTAITGDAASDQVLLSQITSELATDPAIKGAQIDVLVSAGRVTLNGITRDVAQAEAAKSIAQGAAGAAANVTSNLVTGRQ
jgi:osmotically-inducible protein OsmY